MSWANVASSSPAVRDTWGLPLYWLMGLVPATRDGARRLGLITLEQMVRAMVRAIESPAAAVRVFEVPEIRASSGFSQAGPVSAA